MNLFRVENDVKLLRNRVRMLQMEHERAQKKITETYTKAENLERLKEQNNMKYMKNLEAKQKREAELKRADNGKTYAEVRKA